MIFYIVTKVMTGIQTSGYALYWLMTYGVFFLANQLVPHTLKFFTLSRNILTYWIMTTIVSFAAIYAMSIFIPGIEIGETVLDPVSFGAISVNPYSLSPDMTMVIAAVAAGLFRAVLYSLKSDQ